MRIAVLDDDTLQLEVIREAVSAMDHDCHTFTDGRGMLRSLRRESYDLLILDWQLPDISGLEVLRWVRENLEGQVPVLFVTNRQTETDVVEGLRAGADDFMVKPIRMNELAARINALLRRAYRRHGTGDFVIDRFRFEAASVRIFDGEVLVALKQREFDLALFLFQNLGRLLSRKHLLEAVWGVDAELSSRSLDTHVSRLRSKLRLTPDRGYRLASIYSVGYRLETVATASSTTGADTLEDE